MMDIVDKSTENISRKTNSEFRVDEAIDILQTNRLAFRFISLNLEFLLEKLAYQRPEGLAQASSAISTIPFVSPTDIELSDDEEIASIFPFHLPRNRRNAMELDPYIMAQLNHSMQTNNPTILMEEHFDDGQMVQIPSVMPSTGNRRTVEFRREGLHR